MKTIRVRKEETGNELVIFSRYFGYPSMPDANGMIILRDNSNYYTPIYVQECKKDEADYRLINYKSGWTAYYKRLDKYVYGFK